MAGNAFERPMMSPPHADFEQRRNDTTRATMEQGVPVGVKQESLHIQPHARFVEFFPCRCLNSQHAAL